MGGRAASTLVFTQLGNGQIRVLTLGEPTHTRARLLNRLVARLVPYALVPVCRSTSGNHFSEKTPTYHP